MKLDARSWLRSFLSAALPVFVLLAAAGCEKATLGDGLGGGSAGGSHGPDWAEPARHGLEFMADILSCNPCHGEALDGGTSEVSCDACHPGWKGACIFCHGGVDNDTGAPPSGVKGETERSSRTVGAHSAHVEGRESHIAFPCDTCHGSNYVSYRDPGHLDGGEIAAEVVFSGTVGNGGKYDRGAALCSQLYCHGDGQRRSGTLSWVSFEPMACDSCHGYQGDPRTLSGAHGAHLGQLGCDECHKDVISPEGQFVDKGLHINGSPDVRLAQGSYDPGTMTCATACHTGEIPWTGGNHPDGWAEGFNHGFAYFDDPGGCQSCHGPSLTGGTSGVSCDDCHTGGTPAWRTDCTFCHGGIDNVTGAPPEGVHGETARIFAAVGAHTAHVHETATHAAYDCTLCHTEPAAFDDANHIDTNDGAEMRFAALAGAGVTYSPSTTQCGSVYCHGNGRTPSGPVDWTADPTLACNSCHGYTSNPGALSADHRRHANQGIRCSSCHVVVVDTSGRIINKALHVNGNRNVSFSGGGIYNPTTRRCSSLTCHGSETW